MQVIERDTIFKLNVVKNKSDVENYWRERIKQSSDLFEKPKEMYNNKIPKIRFRKEPDYKFRKQKDGDLWVGEEFYINGVMKYSGTYNVKGQRHGKGIAYEHNDGSYCIYYNNQSNSSDFLGLSELCHCNYENGKLHGVLSYVNQGKQNRLYLQVNDPKATPTYSSREQFRFVQANKLISREPYYIDGDYLADGSEYSICQQEFNKGEMTGFYKVYCYLRNGQKIQTEAGNRKNGNLYGFYRKWGWTGKLQEIKDIDKYENSDNEKQKKTTQEQIINEYFPNEYDKLDKGLQSMRYLRTGQIQNVSILKDGDKYKKEIVKFKHEGKLVRKEFTIPKGFHPFLKSGEKVALVYDSGSYFTVQHGNSMWTSTFDEDGNLLKHGYQKPTKGRPRWDDYQGQHRFFKSNNLPEDDGKSQYQTESSYVYSRNKYLKKTYHKNGKLASKIDTTKNTKTIYNENGSFKEVLYQDNYKLCWENEEKLYAKFKGKVNKKDELHGKIVSANMTPKGITYQLKFYENGVEYPYKAFEKLYNMRNKQKAIDFDCSSFNDTFIVTSFDEFKETIDTQISDIKEMVKQLEFEPIFGLINEYQIELRAFNEALTELINAQKIICYLYDVFSVSQISKDLKKEKTKFENEEESWKDNIIKVVKNENNAFQFCSNVKYLRILKEANKKQLTIDNSVTKYLDKQRTNYRLSRDAKKDAIIKKIVAETQNSKPTGKPSTSKLSAYSSAIQNKSTFVSSQAKNITTSKTKLQTQKVPVPVKPNTAVSSYMRSPNKTLNSTSKITTQKSPKQARPVTSNQQPTYKKENMPKKPDVNKILKNQI